MKWATRITLEEALNRVLYIELHIFKKNHQKNVAKEVPKKLKSDDFGDGQKYIRMSAKRCQKLLKLKDFI